MPLKRYREKRDFRVTAEPPGARRSRGQGSYVVQKHAARRLHFDFRLELDGVLKSWAVPKGPSLDPDVKRLAVEVEDHPVEYGSFEGVIPKGQYGAGRVDVWDKGMWQPEGNPHDALKKGHLAFELTGGKLKGRWNLVRIPDRDRPRTESKQWLLIRAQHQAALRSPAAARTTVPRNRRRRAADPMPRTVTPQLATLTKAAPDGDDWLHEIKYDGYRVVVRVVNGEPRIWTRGGHDWTKHFPEIAAAIRALGTRSAILDGEIVVLGPDGKTDFQALQNHMATRSTERPVFIAFDLPYLDGEDLRDLPLEARKAALADLIGHGKAAHALRFSKHVVGGGKELFQEACQSGLEGIVSKRRDAPYRSSRGRSWLKTKCIGRQEFVIGGFTDPAGTRAAFGALLLGVYETGRKLRYCGRVGTGFTRKSLGELKAKLAPLEQSACPFSPPLAKSGGIHWVRPRLVAQIAFSEWTRDGLLRHPAFEGLRTDKPPAQVMREHASVPSRNGTQHKGASDMSTVVRPRRSGTRLTHPDKVLFPDEGLTKEDLIVYYRAVADRMLPHVVGRPLMILRCPEGVGEKCFYQKHLVSRMPSGVHAAAVGNKEGGAERHLTIEDLAGLDGLVQSGVIEVHAWGARVDRIERPDRIAFDLDPGPGIGWPQVVRAAVEVRDRLRADGLVSFVKTTGGKGLHVVVPIERRYEWADVKDYAHGIATAMAADEPARYTATMSKQRRTNRIFIDYLRNGRGATWIVPYSPRARPGALVSMPLTWAQLEQGTTPERFGLARLLRGLPGTKDPWTEMEETRQRLPVAQRPQRAASR